MVLDLPIIEGRDEPFDEEDVVPRGGIWVGQVVQNPHPGVKLLDRLVGELNHAGKLGPQQLRITLGEEPLLILVQSLLRRFGSSDRNVHDGLQGRSLHVRIHELFGFVIGPAVVIGDDLELGNAKPESFLLGGSKSTEPWCYGGVEPLGRADMNAPGLVRLKRGSASRLDSGVRLVPSLCCSLGSA